MASDLTVIIETEMPDINLLARISADVPLSDIAQRTVQDIRGNIRRGVSWNGKFYKKLAKKTIREKTRRNYSQPSTPLYRTGLMYRSIRSYKLRKNLHMIGVSPIGRPKRDRLAEIHQLEGVNQYTRIIRAFFGMSANRKRWAAARMNRWIRSVINKAYLKKVKERRRY